MELEKQEILGKAQYFGITVFFAAAFLTLTLPDQIPHATLVMFTGLLISGTSYLLKNDMIPPKALRDQ